MDRMIYIAMAGAQQLLNQQAVVSHNLANVSTAGYRAETTAFRVAPVEGPGVPTRAYGVETTPGADLTPGTLQRTGRTLDVAIDGPGFFAVETPDGGEAYTRSGNFQVSPDGVLQTNHGQTVLGTGGPIQIPPDSQVAIARDGTVSLTTLGQSAANVTVLGQLKRVNPPASDVVKGADGLFRLKSGQEADQDDTVNVVPEALEGSNVNAVAAMVDMITLARAFDLQMKLLQNAETDAQHATQLLAMGAG